MTSRSDELRAMIRRTTDEIENLIARYGDSIRPAWVGEEIGILAMHRQNAENELRKLDQDSAS